jgi:hypothetical protein
VKEEKIGALTGFTRSTGFKKANTTFFVHPVNPVNSVNFPATVRVLS